MKSYLCAGALSGALLVLAGLLRPGSAFPEQALRAAPAGSPPALSRLTPTVGTAACAGVACHGHEQRRAEDEIRLDEYRLWNLWDPHAHAYHALEGQRSKDMIANLGRGDGFQEAAREPRCLVCHADPSPAVEPGLDDPRSYGVGCESCHGPAQRWLAPHHAGSPPQGKVLEEFGMRNLDEPATLAAVCSGCHVGAPAGEGQPAREVTHDLLAAGHPRLNFELAVFLANLPPHWDPRRKAAARGPDFEARVWAAGQVGAARASLELLEHQARRAAPWPEFAAYDCQACHTSLHSQTRSAGKTLPMGRWYFALLGEVGDHISRPKPGDRGVAEQLEEFKTLMERRPWDAGLVAAKARELEPELAGWAETLKGWKCDPQKAQSLMKSVGRHAPAASWNWEEATQRYLALWALEQASREGKGEQHQQIQKEFLGLADHLAFPPSFAGPRDFSEDKVLGAFQQILEQLGN